MTAEVFVPVGFDPPTSLATSQFHLEPLGPQHNRADHAAWTREQLKPYIAHAIECFGFERSMYGGDWHVMELAIRYPEWVEIVDTVVVGASAAEQRKLFRETAIDFYRLDR